jgi:subfamily B ATP-binding cassette protein MsbA
MREKETLRRIYEAVKPYRPMLAAAMICMLLVAGLSAAQAYMVKPLLDEIFFNQDRFMLNLVPGLLVLLFVVKGISFYGYNYLLSKVGQSIIKDMRNSIYQHVQSLPLAFFHKTPTGELISRVISDVSLIQGAVSRVLVGVIKDFFQMIGLVVVIFYMNWLLALISVVFLPLLIYPIVQFGQRHRRLSINSQQTTALVSNILYETITGNRIVKAFCREEYENRRFAAMLDKLFAITMRDVRLSSLAHPLMEVLGGIGIALVMWYGGTQVLNGAATPGTFFSFLTALIMIYEPLKGLSKINSTLQQGVAASVRVFTLLDVKNDIEEKKDAPQLPLIRNAIEFKGVSFSYDDNVDVLKDINLTVRAGEVLAIVGASGGGKTSLVNLIPRFCDVRQGSITIDGHDIRDVRLQSLRRQIGMVTQQTILFNDTVRNNIAYGAFDCTEEDIIAAARAAHSFDFITNLPEGFDTVIGESGARLSGGERQRISIARALLKNAPILILDEATSSLDTESEREVQKALENLMKNRTTFVIAHRLSTIRNADRIIVVQEGRIVEEGTHDSLLPKGGAYTTLYTMQFQD